MLRFVFLSLFIVGVVLLSPSEASAAVTCNGTIKSGVCFPATSGLSDAHVDVLLKKLMNWLLGIFGVIAIIAFVISGLQYLLATGDERMAETAKRNAQYSVVGIIVALSGWVIIRAIDQALSVGGNLLF
jgi:preprotein translocase subunit SecG